MRLLYAPTADRYCKRCGKKTEFVSSGLFRVNAQKKSLDVWLIYKCDICDTTWNLPVLSRVSPQSIPADMLNRFHRNDAGLAVRCAADTAAVKRNGGEPRQATFEVTGESDVFSKPTRIHLVTEYALELKVSAVVCEKLGISKSEFKRLCDAGKLLCVSGQDIYKCKLNGTIQLETR